jgi:hypothetical protein
MKFLSCFLVICSFLFVLPAAAQSEPDLNELIARTKITTFQSINDVFTSEELLMLQEHYDKTGEQSPIPRTESGSLFYGKEDQSGFYGSVSLADPSTMNMISTSPATGFEGAGAISNDANFAYAIDGANNFWHINVPTGQYTNLGKVKPPNGETFTGMEMDHTDNNKIYAVSSDNTQSSLSIINPSTLLVTLVAVTILVVAISLAITPAGQLITMDIDDDKVYSLDKLTGLAILIGAIGFDANFGGAMALNVLTGLIYMAAYNVATLDSELRIVNILTGLTTLVAIIIIGALAQFGWMGIPDASLDVGENSSNNDISIFPNPVGDLLNLRSKIPIESISLFNIMGQQLLQRNIGTLNSQLDISNLASGQYVVLATVNGHTESFKIVKE